MNLYQDVAGVRTKVIPIQSDEAMKSQWGAATQGTSGESGNLRRNQAELVLDVSGCPLIPSQVEQHEYGEGAAVCAMGLPPSGDGRFRLIDELRDPFPFKTPDGVVVGEVA